MIRVHSDRCYAALGDRRAAAHFCRKLGLISRLLLGVANILRNDAPETNMKDSLEFSGIIEIIITK
jgi:hypothetical protein